MDALGRAEPRRQQMSQFPLRESTDETPIRGIALSTSAPNMWELAPDGTQRVGLPLASEKLLASASWDTRGFLGNG